MRAARPAGDGTPTLDGRRTASHEIGGSGRGCGRVVASGSSRAVTQRSLPARPKASALRPDPELVPRTAPATSAARTARSTPTRMSTSSATSTSSSRASRAGLTAEPDPDLVPPPASRRRTARSTSVTELLAPQPELGRGRAPVERQRAHAVGVDEQRRAPTAWPRRTCAPSGPAGRSALPRRRTP